jgi:hypothetical protein
VSSASVVVSIEDGSSSRGIVRDAIGEMWLASELPANLTTRLGSAEVETVVLDAGRLLVGGRARAGAVDVIVVDARGQRVRAQVANGAWVAILENKGAPRAPIPVLQTDSTGEAVAKRMPPNCTRQPVRDSDVSCPACLSSEWEVVSAAVQDAEDQTEPGSEESRSQRSAVVCRVCSFEQNMVQFVRAPRRVPALVPTTPSDAELAADRELRDAIRRRKRRRKLQAVRFPVVGVSGFTGTMTDISGDSTLVASVTISFDLSADATDAWARVRTAPAMAVGSAGLERLARDGLASSYATPSTRRSQAAFTLELLHVQRIADGKAEAASSFEVNIRVNGEPNPFVIVKTDADWAAAGQVSGVVATVVAHGVTCEQLSLSLSHAPSEDFA